MLPPRASAGCISPSPGEVLRCRPARVGIRMGRTPTEKASGSRKSKSGSARTWRTIRPRRSCRPPERRHCGSAYSRWPVACLTVSDPGKAPTDQSSGRLITGVNDVSQSYSRLWIAVAVVLVSAAAGAALLRGSDPGNPRIRTTRATVYDCHGYSRGLRALDPTKRHGRGRRGCHHHRDATSFGSHLGSLVITKLIKAGTPVGKGHLVVEFDRQTQLRHTRSPRGVERSRAADQKEGRRRAPPRGRVTTARSCSPTAGCRARSSETVKNELLPKFRPRTTSPSSRPPPRSIS